MKISSFLLSSAAILVAGSAFAADLPAKKAAPAATAAASCPAFGAGYFPIPGGETCIKVGGYVRSDNRYITYPDSKRPASANYQLGYKFILGVDSMSNTEFGNLHGRIGLYDASLIPNATQTADTTAHTGGAVGTESAYLELGGFRAGFAPSTVDYNNAYNLSGLQYQPPGVTQLAYTSSLGGTTKLTVAAESTTWSDQNYISGSVGGTAARPDLIASVSSTIDGISLKAGAVSHEVAALNGTGQGWAALGRADVKFGDIKLLTGAAFSNGAIAYVNNPSEYGSDATHNDAYGCALVPDSDANGQNLATASMETAALEYAMGANTLYTYAGSVSASQSTTGKSYAKTIYGVGYKYMIGKTFYVRPELYQYTENTGSGPTNYTAVWVRFRRDF